MVQDIVGSNPIPRRQIWFISSFSYSKLYINSKGNIMNKKELNALLNEASRLLDEIEVTIDNMFYAAYKSQNQL